MLSKNELKKMHTKLAEHYLQQYQNNINKSTAAELALSNYLVLKKLNVGNLNQTICDLMLHSKYMDNPEELQEHIHDYIDECQKFNLPFDIKYSLIMVFIDLLKLTNMCLTSSILNETQINQIVQKLQGHDPRLVDYDIRELVISIQEKDVDKFIECLRKIDTKTELDQNTVSILLLIKNLLY